MDPLSALPAERDALALAKRYLAAIEHGATGDVLAEFFTQDVIQEEFPNQLVPQGARRTRQAILDGALRGQQVMAGQQYELLHAVVSGNEVALEVQWTGTLAMPVGALPVGGQMRARFAVFLEFRDGKIAAQHNYDCFDPF